ncbi:MAG TPA: pyridoxamine 5'-phosphate oxidase family protein [Patescibacteria group bacterium]|nr:pyridoxamine 5'-phosphate oxidase family protein [Patescibacteria group bacterium]
MDTRVVAFLKAHRISVLAISQTDNSVHAATLHYAFSMDPAGFFFITEKDSQKCKSLADGGQRPASLVVGFSEEEFATFQADGQIQMIGDVHHAGWDVYIDKYPTRNRAKLSDEYVLLVFVPTQWKFTDIKTDPKTKITSDGLTFP